ncbi:MAG: PilZ domain-containing protein [Acidobacteriota bacterium]
MEYKGLERRACIRFEIPGAAVSYKKKGFLLSSKSYGEEFCPVLDISRGGLRFLALKPLKINTPVTMKISIPGERIPLLLKGKVRWSGPHVGKNYKYQIGVQFNPYGQKKDQNYPGNLVKIIALEQKFSPEEKQEKRE